MRQIFFYCLTLILFVGCKKENGPRVEIYLVKSFTSTIDQSTTPATISITNAVPENIPLVADEDIQFYAKEATTFILKKDIQTIIKNYGSDKAFVVTVDNQPIYYGKFHPLHLSSIIFGVATIAPFSLNKNKLEIHFATIGGNSLLQQYDKRNDSRIINALKATNRLL